MSQTQQNILHYTNKKISGNNHFKTQYSEMKFIPVILILVLSSCISSIVYVKHPLPKMRIDQNEFNSDIVGEYLITDTIIDVFFFDAFNELYNPKICLEPDTSFFVTVQMKVFISKHTIISKKLFTGYMSRSFYDSRDKELSNEIDTIIFIEDTVKLISKEQIDTLINIQNQDIVREYKEHYLLNKWHKEGFQPILLTKTQNGYWKILDIEENRLLEYYYSFDSEKMDMKAELVDNDEAIKLKNSELKYLIRNDYFTTRYSLSKKTKG